MSSDNSSFCIDLALITPRLVALRVCNEKTSTCVCDEGYGAPSDITNYRSPDCTSKTCPSGIAWADLATTNKTAHAVTECSNRGICDRHFGTCKCFPGAAGAACDRSACPNDCSGHGQCMSMKELAQKSNALPLSNNSYYDYFEVWQWLFKNKKSISDVRVSRLQSRGMQKRPVLVCVTPAGQLVSAQVKLKCRSGLVPIALGVRIHIRDYISSYIT